MKPRVYSRAGEYGYAREERGLLAGSERGGIFFIKVHERLESCGVYGRVKKPTPNSDEKRSLINL